MSINRMSYHESIKFLEACQKLAIDNNHIIVNKSSAEDYVDHFHAAFTTASKTIKECGKSFSNRERLLEQLYTLTEKFNTHYKNTQLDPLPKNPFIAAYCLWSSALSQLICTKSSRFKDFCYAFLSFYSPGRDKHSMEVLSYIIDRELIGYKNRSAWDELYQQFMQKNDLVWAGSRITTHFGPRSDIRDSLRIEIEECIYRDLSDEEIEFVNKVEPYVTFVHIGSS